MQKSLKNTGRGEDNPAPWRGCYVWEPTAYGPTVGEYWRWKTATGWGFGHTKSVAGNLTVQVLVTSTFVSLEPRTCGRSRNIC